MSAWIGRQSSAVSSYEIRTSLLPQPSPVLTSRSRVGGHGGRRSSLVSPASYVCPLLRTRRLTSLLKRVRVSWLSNTTSEIRQRSVETKNGTISTHSPSRGRGTEPSPPRESFARILGNPSLDFTLRKRDTRRGFHRLLFSLLVVVERRRVESPHVVDSCVSHNLQSTIYNLSLPTAHGCSTCYAPM